LTIPQIVLRFQSVNTPGKQYNVPFNSDGESTTLSIDCSVAPVSEDFRGNLPTGIVDPAITGEGIVGDLANVTVQLNGTTVLFTFPNALPQFDNANNLILYNAAFVLQYGD